MRRSHFLAVALALLAGLSSARADDRLFLELAGVGVGPGIPAEGEGLAFGGELGLLVQEEESDGTLLFRVGFDYMLTLDGWADDPRDVHFGGLFASVGYGISDLDPVLPFVEIGLDPTVAFFLDGDEYAWDWSLGIRADFGVLFAMGDYVSLRTALGYKSLLFSDPDRPMGGLWFTLALGFDLDPDTYDGYDPPDPDEFTLYASYSGMPGRASTWIDRSDGFDDAVSVWAEPPDGIQAVVLPDPSAGADHWKVLVRARPGMCTEFTLRIVASGGGEERATTVWMAPSCDSGGAP